MNNDDVWEHFFRNRLDQLDDLNQLRYRGGSQSAAVQTGCDDSAGEFIDFGSNDYLAIRQHPNVTRAVASAVARHGWGSGASPVLSGYSREHEQLEQLLADLNGTEAALVFSSGFACHSGVIAALSQTGDALYSDQLNHASLIDGCRLSKAERVIYPHCDTDFLVDHLHRHRHRYRKVLIVTESVFSMDGDQAPLRELSEIAEQFNCGLIVDEAHATGVYGSSGGGLVSELDLTSAVLAKLGTLSKAVGSIGGYVCGSQRLIEFLINVCRSYIFSTAPPAAMAAGSAAAIRLIQVMQAERRALRTTSDNLRNRLREIGWQVPLGDSPIIPVIVGDEVTTLGISRRLAERHIHVPAIRPPTVPPSTCRLRISLATSHRSEELERLLNVLQDEHPIL